MSAVLGQKGSEVEGGLVSTEFLESHGTDASLKKGAQQFFTPPEAARLVKSIIDPDSRLVVADLTAGDGALLGPYEDGMRYGVEIDPDQIRSAKEQGREYHSIQASLPDVFPLLYKVVPSLDAVVLNPPFGLTWVDDTIKKNGNVNSTVAAFVYATRLLAADGQIALIAGKERMYREVLTRPEADGVYAVIDCDDLYDGHGAQLACSIAFAISTELRTDGKGGTPNQFETRECPRGMLDLCSQWVLELREAAQGSRYNRPAHYTDHSRRAKIAEAWRAAGAEHRRRVEKKESERPAYDVTLFGGGKQIQVEPTAYALMAVRKLRPEWGVTLARLNGMSLTYFIQNERDWHTLKSIGADGLVTIAPDVEGAIDKLLVDKRRILVPLYPIKEHQRLGWLDEQDVLRCKKSDPEKGFVEGERYALETRVKPDERKEVRWETNRKTGEPEEREYTVRFKTMEIRIGHVTINDSGSGASERIAWLTEHFEMPDPGDVGTMFPEETDRMRQIIKTIEAEMIVCAEKWDEANDVPEHKRFKGFKTYQVEDLSRMLVKGSGLLAWEQGLGKTLGALVYSEAATRLGAKDQRLFIVPGDLIPQWQREAERFFDRKIQLIKPRKVGTQKYTDSDGKTKTRDLTDTVHAQLRRVRAHLKAGGTGWYITYWEALSRVHVGLSQPADTIVIETRVEKKLKPGTGKYGPHPDTGVFGYHPPEYIETEREITSRDVCPKCLADKKDGWNGLVCRHEDPNGDICGYVHYKARVKPAASVITTAFRKGVIIIDEATGIQGESARSEAIRGLSAKYKLGMTGTPIKNYVGQAFWILWWCLGNASERFPYGYKNKAKFLDNFAVMEAYYTGKGNRMSSPKQRPEVTNLSMLWRLLASSIIRRRKEETGEPIVPKITHEVQVPLGVYQQRYNDKVLADFGKLFKDKYPNHPVVKAGLQDVLALMLGGRVKLNYGAILPALDPDLDWWGIDGVSNWTPGTLKVLETALCLVKQGRKVLIGSPLKETSRFLADQLAEKGVDALHVLNEAGVTVDKDKRAALVYDFQTNDVDVLCSGIQSIRHGHNVDAANAVILHGLPDDFESLDQFIARVHRLTSQMAVDVYVVIPRDTLTAKKWELLKSKGESAGIALDGRLIEQEEERVDWNEVLREMVERGVPVTDDDVEEADIFEAWQKVPQLDEFVIPEAFIKSQAEKQAELKALAAEAAMKANEKWATFSHSMLDLLTHANTEIVAGVEAMFESYTSFVQEKRAEALLTDEDRHALAWWMEHDPEAFDESAEMFPTDRARLARAAYQQATEVPEPEEPITVEVPHTPVTDEDFEALPILDPAILGESEVFDGEQAHDEEPEQEPDETVPTTAAAADPKAVAEGIKAMKELHELGVLDDDEFAEAKANLIASLKPVAAAPAKKPAAKKTTTTAPAASEQLALV